MHLTMQPQDGRKRRESPANTDGYSWKKYAMVCVCGWPICIPCPCRYGEKVLKETGVPRSYYKCSVPGCNAKKYVEYTEEGDVAECIIKGEHNHSRSRAGARASADSGGAVRASTRRRQPKPAMHVVRDAQKFTFDAAPLFYVHHSNPRSAASCP